MTTRKLKTGTLYRSVQIDRAAVKEEARTVELAFSSETPVERWFGNEILDHGNGSIRLDRLRAGGPLLLDHRMSDHVGVVESVTIGPDRVGRAVVRFGRSAKADEVFRDVLDGIRQNVSVGYQVNRMQLVEKKKGGDGTEADTYRVVDWTPLEISLVAIPADASVGVGRSADAADAHETLIEGEERAEPETPPAAAPAAEPAQPTNPARASGNTPEAPMSKEIIEQARADVQKQVAEIMTIGERMAKFGGTQFAVEYVRGGGTDVEAFRQKMLDKIQSGTTDTRDAAVGLSEKETQNFSLLRAINALVTGDWSRAGFEREASQAVAQRLGRDARGFYVPQEVQRAPMQRAPMQRDQVVGTAGAGGNLVATNLLVGSFIDMLRNRMAVTGLGARMLTGLVGNMAIPRQTGGASAYWVNESGAPTESQSAFDQVTLTPKTVGAFSDISRKLLLQSSLDVEAFVRQELATTVALEIDRVAINGSGSGAEPRGILNTVGIGSVVGGTNGAAPTFGNIVALETSVSVANADVGNLAYLTNAKVRGKLKVTERAAGTNGVFVWGTDAEPINGYRAAVSNQVPSNLDKGTSTGVCSAILFGNFADLMIGQWGVLDIMVDPYTHSTSGTVRIVALNDVDVAIRHAESFSAMVDALTA